jgi:hypothetical protein
MVAGPTHHRPSLWLAIVPCVADTSRGAVVRVDKKKCAHLSFCNKIRYNVEIEKVDASINLRRFRVQAFFILKLIF